MKSILKKALICMFLFCVIVHVNGDIAKLNKFPFSNTTKKFYHLIFDDVSLAGKSSLLVGDYSNLEKFVKNRLKVLLDNDNITNMEWHIAKSNDNLIGNLSLILLKDLLRSQVRAS